MPIQVLMPALSPTMEKGNLAKWLKKGFANEDRLKKIDAEVRAMVNEAAEFATNDAEPDPSELYTDVYK